MIMSNDLEYLKGKEEILARQELAEEKLRAILETDPELIAALEAIQGQIRNTKDDIFRVKLQIRNNSK